MIESDYPYVYKDGIVFERGCAGETQKISVLVATGFGGDGVRRVPPLPTGTKRAWPTGVGYI
jgi:transposase-like protein